MKTTASVRPGVRLHTLRARVTAAASVVITAAVVSGLLVMYLLQMNSVRRTIDSQLRTYGTVIQQTYPTGDWPATLPVSSLDSNAEAQVIAADGTVLAASRNLVGLPPVFVLPPGSTTPVRQKAADGVVPGSVRVVAMRITVAGRPVTIITGTPTDLLTEVENEFIRHLMTGLPIILILSALAVWLIVGRALRPVERIRHAVTDISSEDLSRRVPDPGTPDEIGRLAQTMNEMLARLEQSTERQRRFVADASHELRSPLAAIRTTLEVGLAHPDRAPWPKIAGRAADQSIRLEGLIENLLRLARSDEGEVAVPDQHVDVEVLLREITDPAPARAVAVELDVTGSPAVDGDAESLGRLFRNIVDNAVRHASSMVHITAVNSDGVVEVAIADDGPGIPETERERVFDRFVRLDSSRNRTTGSSGLGLAIAREITLSHRGEITIGDSPAGGACVIIRLPETGRTSESVR